MNLLGGLGHNEISSSRTFSLTAKGKTKADEMDNNKETRVLMAIEDCQDGTVTQIEAHCNIPRRKLERILRKLWRRGHIVSTREPSGDE